jgi:hypothetical protein
LTAYPKVSITPSSATSDAAAEHARHLLAQVENATSPGRIPGTPGISLEESHRDLERATSKAKIIHGRSYCGAESESKTNISGLRSAQDRGNALADNAAVEHCRIHPDVCGVVLRGGLQNAEVAR